MPESNREAVDGRLVRALAHPLRVQILEILSERVASPVDLSAELGVDLGHVAYHTRTLDSCGCLELVDTAQRRGAVEHFYKAAPGASLSWIPLELDEAGWKEVTKIVEEARRRVLDTQRRSAERLPDATDKVTAVVALANFETRAKAAKRT
jgi:DNA-binding transcriptional ArsR family regulator